MNLPDDNGTAIEYKAWMPIEGGGSETIGVTLPLGSTIEQMDLAIQQWRLMREKALPALREATQAAQIQATAQTNLPIEEIKLPFGKYKGMTLGSIYAQDPGYLEWMAYKSDPERTQAEWRERAKQIVENPPSASYAPSDISDEDIPF